MAVFKRNNKEFSCPIELALNDISGKWKVLILWRINQNQTIRYGELKRLLPQQITHNSLSRSLKDLVKSGLIKRKDFKTIPPKVEYSMTELGKGLVPGLELIRQWGIQFKV